MPLTLNFIDFLIPFFPFLILFGLLFGEFQLAHFKLLSQPPALVLVLHCSCAVDVVGCFGHHLLCEFLELDDGYLAFGSGFFVVFDRCF